MKDNKIIQTLIEFEEEPEIDLQFIKVEADEIELSQSEKALHERVCDARGASMYVDILLFLTHQYFPVEIAQDLWEEILNHKNIVNSILGRDVGIVVATLDYLSNVRDVLKNVVVMPEKTRWAVTKIALKDSLTGLYDKGTFKSMLNSEMRRFERYGNDVSLILLDIDHFKAINDTYGHSVGDKVLARIGEALQKLFRETETAARVGGEEFAVILPQSDFEEAYIAAERIRKQIQQLFEDDYQMTVSIGVANCPRSASTAHDLIVQADNALYASKQAGRNCTTKANATSSTNGKKEDGDPPERMF